jgi:hypothetical protein
VRFAPVCLIVLGVACNAGRRTPRETIIDVALTGDRTCAFEVDEWIGTHPGCPIELAITLDPVKVSDWTGWSVSAYGPPAYSPIPIAFDDDGRAVHAFTVPQHPSPDWRWDDKWVAFTVYDAGGARVRHGYAQRSLISIDRASAPPAWLWHSYWTVNGVRVLADGWDVECADDIRIVSHVGGNLASASRLRIHVIDIDPNGEDTLEERVFPVGEEAVFELVPGDLCRIEGPDEPHSTVDPAFVSELYDHEDRLLHSLRGYELDPD